MDLVVLVGILAVFFYNGTLTARATIGMMPFGGRILYYDIGSPPPAFCLPHTVIFDYVTFSTFGVMEAPGSMVYRYGNLFTPEVNLLGEYVLVPIPCVRPYPLYDIFQVGTSAY